MYHYHYNVIVLSQDLSLYEKVVAFPSLAGFTNIVSHVEKINTSISDADLLICQGSAAELKQTLPLVAAEAVKVFVAEPKELEQLPKELLAQLDDFWSFTYERCSFGSQNCQAVCQY